MARIIADLVFSRHWDEGQVTQRQHRLAYCLLDAALIAAAQKVEHYEIAA